MDLWFYSCFLKINFEGIVHAENTIWWFTHPQAIQDGFVSSSEQIWRNLTLHHVLPNRPSAVKGCRQN